MPKNKNKTHKKLHITSSNNNKPSIQQRYPKPALQTIKRNHRTKGYRQYGKKANTNKKRGEEKGKKGKSRASNINNNASLLPLLK
jgi:hypothetical protein